MEETSQLPTVGTTARQQQPYNNSRAMNALVCVLSRRWAQANNLTLNWAKSQELLFVNGRRK